jgi:toxin ParE1/3/4
MKPVAFSKLAKREIDAAAQWFEDRKEGLGKQFYQQVDEAAEKIERNPEGFQKVHQDMHRVGLRQFTEWALYFRILTDGSLVIACISGKRHPALRHERASGVIPIKP